MKKILFAFLFTLAHATEQWKTSSGVPVYWQYEQSVPMQEVLIVFDVGSRHFQPGHLKLMTDSMYKGSRYFSKESLKQLLYNQGIMFETTFDRDSFSLYYKTPLATDNTQFVRVLEASALSPVFPYNEVKQAAIQQYDFLRESLSSLNDVCLSATLKALFPGAPNYAASYLGKGEEIKYIHPAELKIIHKSVFQRHHAKIIMIGALSKEKARDLADKIAMKLSKNTQAPPSTESLSVTNTPQSKHIPFAGSQTRFVFSKKIPINPHSDSFPALLLANHILGEMTDSNLLNDYMRENKGWVYDINSKVKVTDDFSVLLISGQTKQSQPERFSDVILSVINKLNNGDFSEEYFKRAKSNLIINLSFNDSNTAKIFTMKQFLDYGLSPDFDATLIKAINALQLDDIVQVSKLFSTNQFYSVYVGKEK